MKKEIKMNVVGNENIIVNTETGEISGRTYNAKDWIKRNFGATWNKEKKVWMADPAEIKEELTKNASYYEKYIISDPEETKEVSKQEIKEKKHNESTEKIEESNDEIVDESLVNRYDGFYKKTTYKSGKVTYSFIG